MSVSAISIKIGQGRFRHPQLTRQTAGKHPSQAVNLSAIPSKPAVEQGLPSKPSKHSRKSPSAASTRSKQARLPAGLSRWPDTRTLARRVYESLYEEKRNTNDPENSEKKMLLEKEIFLPELLTILLSTWLLLAALPGAIASYSVGVGRADTTGPVAEVVFMGYAKIDQKGSGLHLRTFSRAFIIDDGEERFVFVSVDSAMIGNGVRQTVLQNLANEFGSLYTEKNVMISATHSHSTPGGFMLHMLFDITTFGFVKETFDAMVNGITKSIHRAHHAMVPGRVFIAHGEVHGVNINRSPAAYLNNPKSERDKYKHDVDKILTQVQFIGADDRPLGVINWFAIHPTSMNNTNHLVSSDNVGYASILFEKIMNNDSLPGKGSFVAAFASSNLGDVSPNTRGPKCEFSGNNCSEHYTCPGRKEMCFASGPGKDMFESTSIIANKIFKESWKKRQISRWRILKKSSKPFPKEDETKKESVFECYLLNGLLKSISEY
ncbi:Neutral ceramidase [Melipona quadrifasciata]|uniref:Neutral ceramidase n=1 Tax=Melipona quadrifasciata TaxID=166423 RepID=A0A0M8ZWP9_9HYME|nr:Neutral ceramidase [Melipona quadrifasciata]